MLAWIKFKTIQLTLLSQLELRQYLNDKEVQMRLQINAVKKEQYAKYLELIPDLKREKAQKYITIVLTLATTIILGLFAINPTFSTIANLQKQIDDGNFVEQKLKLKINDLSI